MTRLLDLTHHEADGPLSRGHRQRRVRPCVHASRMRASRRARIPSVLDELVRRARLRAVHVRRHRRVGVADLSHERDALRSARASPWSRSSRSTSAIGSACIGGSRRGTRRRRASIASRCDASPATCSNCGPRTARRVLALSAQALRCIRDPQRRDDCSGTSTGSSARRSRRSRRSAAAPCAACSPRCSCRADEVRRCRRLAERAGPMLEFAASGRGSAGARTRPQDPARRTCSGR